MEADRTYDSAKVDEAYMLSVADFKSARKAVGLASLTTAILAFLSIAVNLKLLTSGTLKLGFAELVLQESLAIKIVLIASVTSSLAFAVFSLHDMATSGRRSYYAKHGSALATLMIGEVVSQETDNEFLVGAANWSIFVLAVGIFVIVVTVFLTFVWSFFL